MKKKVNKRCPLQAECERECQNEGHEMDCDYYENNAVGEDRTIPDQEERRREIERKRDEEMWSGTEFDEDEDEDDEEGADAEADAALTSNTGKLVYIPIERLHPHPRNPRRDLGDLSELADSIRAKGILQNLTVVPMELTDPDATIELGDGHYTILIGHRRHAGAQLAGLGELPCVIVEMDEREQVQTMLLENMQRSDLTVYEQAQGFQMMLDLGSTIEEIAEKTGFSQTTVRRRVKMMELDQDKLKEVSGRQLSLSDFDRLAQVEDIKTRNKILENIGTSSFDGAVFRALREENRKKVTPAARKQVKKLGLKEIPENKRYSGKYESFRHINLNDWKPEDGLGLQEADGVLYTLDSWGLLTFYRERKKAAVKKKSKKQMEREKAIANASAALTEEAAVAFELRQKFVQTLSVTKYTLPLYLRGAVIGTVASAILFKSADWEALLRLFGVKPNVKYNEMCRDAVKAVTAYEGDDLTPAVVYALFQDSKTNGYHVYVGDWPKHKENLMLDALYAWLTLMGYEMSDAERALRDGSHELFRDNASAAGTAQEEDPCALCKSVHPFCDKCCKTCDDHCNSGQVCRKKSEAGQ